jgi:hypothetical protein
VRSFAHRRQCRTTSGSHSCGRTLSGMWMPSAQDPGVELLGGLGLRRQQHGGEERQDAAHGRNLLCRRQAARAHACDSNALSTGARLMLCARLASVVNPTWATTSNSAARE